jgi:hypothetical protein
MTDLPVNSSQMSFASLFQDKQRQSLTKDDFPSLKVS